ncbi:hypothetical protein Emtol_3286 [Emticicia oligotrophica DSM 17448]|uniref:Lcl C-terminal domain-containing protein n=1 Tax=Emticicia oligotrophica (strain DSM 17448 / CIP 109782 / MTCC 6937 / GPTSA100-15) TaxID=929562 RepID=A0ABN4AQ23_EMTOG|nr:DUF1566 domain-containing protein [Emticicia oligotrophica]AFK04415.1 hypothetical protein Emtol_3286 [Emticicia oligotrophica DSM 17448]
MKKLYNYFWLLFIIGFLNKLNAQSVLIDPANTTSILNAQSTTKGLLPPRLTEAQRNAMTGLTAGTVIHCSDCAGGVGPYSYNGSSWVAMFSSNSVSYSVGQSKFGGVIFFVDDSGQHGLVAATTDQSVGTTWYNGNYINTLATRTGVFGGANNTERIITEQGAGNYAASIASQGSNGGFGDWYLPSKDEMAKMYQQIGVIPSITAGANYWSSTEESVSNLQSTSTNAYVTVLSTGVSSLQSKSSNARVRAIRRF